MIWPKHNNDNHAGVSLVTIELYEDDGSEFAGLYLVTLTAPCSAEPFDGRMCGLFDDAASTAGSFARKHRPCVFLVMTEARA